MEKSVPLDESIRSAFLMTVSFAQHDIRGQRGTCGNQTILLAFYFLRKKIKIITIIGRDVDLCICICSEATAI